MSESKSESEIRKMQWDIENKHDYKSQISVLNSL